MNEEDTLRNSFLNLKTGKNKFFDKGINDENLSRTNDKLQSYKLNNFSMIEMMGERHNDLEN